ncbi:MAG: substrate-binding domain-containing protein [Candidatus Thiodiazotropha sp.]|nr:substrate-binding domain-containing protein [Candidatus Thiodiazotropha sp.]
MKKIILILVASISGLVFAGGNSESDGGGSNQYTIGVALETFDDVFIQRVKDEVEKTAAILGVRVVLVDGKSDPAEQVRQIETFIANKVDAIIVHLINQDIAGTISEKAITAEIPLVYMNQSVPSTAVPPGKKVAIVASPEIEAGKGQAKYVVKTLAKKEITSGNVVILLGGLGSPSQIGRTNGVKEYLAQNAPEFKVIREQTANWKRPDAVAVIENWLASGDQFVAVFANNDEMALGASLSLKEAGIRKEVLIVGVNANSDAVVAIGNGDIDMSMFQNGRAQGSGSVEVAVKMIKGESFSQTVDIPFEPVTKDNYSQYQ